MIKTKDLEHALRIYKATYDVTDAFFMDVIGIKSRSTWKYLRTGKREFSAKQLHQLSIALGIGMNELYEMLPAINHEEVRNA